MRLPLCLSLAAALAVPAAAQTLQADADPVAGTERARADREPVAFDLTVRATDAHPDAECAGNLDPSAPDAVVRWDGGPLQLWVRGDLDATLTVVGPDGAVRCDDDTEGRLPAVAYGQAERGRYAVWVGAFTADDPAPDATLYAGSPTTPELDAGARPTDGTIELRAGFGAQADEAREVSAAGADALSDVATADDAGCFGFARADRPSARVRYQGGGQPLVLQASSADDVDLVLAVAMPDGGVRCNDDFDPMASTDPGLVIGDAPSGDYAVWVGTWGSHARADAPRATLRLSETAPVVSSDPFTDVDVIDDPGFMGDFGGDPYSTGTFTPFDPDARAAETARYGGDLTVEGVQARGEVPSPVSGPACTGSLPTRPSLAVALDAQGPLALRATAELDLVLAARLPDGTWMCSDDADGTNPGIQIDGAQRGTLTVWVGTFGPEGEATATVTLAEGTVERTVPDFGGLDDPGPSGVPFTPGTYAGSGLEVDAPLQTLRLDGRRVRANVAVAPDLANPVAGDACVGFVTARPSAAVDAAEDGPLSISAFSATDAVMVVRTPAGDWFCSDDADRTEPRVDLDGAAGTYAVWLGTFSRGTEAQMTLVARHTDAD